MPSAPGSAVRNSANTITLMFVTEGHQITFSGTVSPSIQPFSVGTTTVTYNDIDDLKSTHSFTGQIGPNTFELKFDNGTSVTGKLNPPGVDPATVVNGSGQWEQI